MGYRAALQSWEFVPQDLWNPTSFLRSRKGAEGAGGVFSATTGGFSPAASCSPRANAPGGISRGFRDGTEQQIHPCWHTVGSCWCSGQPGTFYTKPRQSHSELLLCCGSRVWCSRAAPSKPGFGKLTLVAAGGRGTVGTDGCPALGCKTSRFSIFLKDLSWFFPSKPLENLPYLHATSGKMGYF